MNHLSNFENMRAFCFDFVDKEMLKELMHSMGMSLVREKAVSSFMERLDKRVQSTNSKQRVKKIDRGGASGSTTAAAVAAKVAAITVDAVSTKGAGLGTAGVSVGIAYGPVVAGWLELRKGFHSLLTSDGSLVIFRYVGISEWYPLVMYSPTFIVYQPAL